MARRAAKKRRGPRPTAVAPHDRLTPARPAIMIHPRAAERRVQIEARIADQMLVECPTFGVTVKAGRLYAEAKDRVPSAVCPTCGLTPDYVFTEGCPRMRTQEQAMMAMLPPEFLFAEPEEESGVILPAGV